MGWKDFYQEQVEKSTMQVREVPVTNIRIWGIQPHGNLARPDGMFFIIAGLTIFMGDPEQREVPNWDQPIIKEIGRGCVGLIKAKGEDKFLVQFKAEPGNITPGKVLPNSPLSASESNLKAAHGGKRPPFAEYAENPEIQWYAIPQDGGKYLGKVNKYSIIEVDPAKIAVPGNCLWVTKQDCREMLGAGLIPEHLLQVFGIMYLMF
ncbi:NDP-hexose 2,3-dehydratase family protein [Candidatus Falkowbacteria bacterium]|nr:NDP-hexose 2,3-dehydratase family protein [Candidatus Falkowbacteria bacterium]